VALSPGSVFAGYVIERRVGAGGMGAVYVARHPRLPRRVALKVLSGGLGSDAEFRARFEREAELAARVDHPNVVSVYDRGVEDDQLWIAMQFVDGVDAHALLKRGPSVMTPSRAVFILSEAAKGLDCAHRRGLLHRDVKPANILVAEDPDEGDQVLVTDFGIARAVDQTSALTSAGSLPATLAFASPEQITGQKLDHRSDIYSLGCTLYMMLTGSVPFPRESHVAVIAAHLAEPPPRVTLRNPSLPAEMDEVIARAMAKYPAHRYPSCRQLALAAQAALSRSDGAEWAAAETVPARSAASVLRSNPSIPPVAQPVSRAASDPAVAAVDGTETVETPGSAETVVRGDSPQWAQPVGQGSSGPAPLAPFPPAPSLPAPSRPRKKHGLIVAGVVAAVVVGVVSVVAFLAFGNGKAGDTGVSSSTAAQPTAAPVGPWQAYDFVAKALPGLMPDTPSGTGYQGATCQAVDASYTPIDDLKNEVPIARIVCKPANGQINNYNIHCNSDRSPTSSSVGLGDDVTGVSDEQWSRGSGSGRVKYGTIPAMGIGILRVNFDSPARNFCWVEAYGKKGTTGQDVYNGWFRDAPL
jgi:serine/threonine protein kinase